MTTVALSSFIDFFALAGTGLAALIFRIVCYFLEYRLQKKIFDKNVILESNLQLLLLLCKSCYISGFEQIEKCTDH